MAPWLPFALDALSYVGSVAPFSRLPSSRPIPDPTAARSSVWAEMGGGLRWIQDHPFLRPLTLAIAVFHLGTAGAFSMLVLLITEVLDAPDLVFGIVLSAAAVGATLASLSAARLTDRFSRRNVITSSAAVAALTVVAAGLATSAWMVIVVWTLNGAAGGVLLAIGRGFVQRHAPTDRLGRTAIASRMITRTSFVIGRLGAAAEPVGEPGQESHGPLTTGG